MLGMNIQCPRLLILFIPRLRHQLDGLPSKRPLCVCVLDSVTPFLPCCLLVPSLLSFVIPAEHETLCENPQFSPTQVYSWNHENASSTRQLNLCLAAAAAFWSRLFFHTCSCIISHLQFSTEHQWIRKLLTTFTFFSMAFEGFTF